MKLLWHLAKKDLRAARLPLLIWIALSALTAGWQIRIVSTSAEAARNFTDFYQLVGVLVLFGTIAIPLSIVSTVVHADPLVTTTAFWLTRPIPPRRLFLSKLVAMGGMLLGPPILIQSAALAWLGVPAATIAHLAGESAFLLMVPAMLVFVAASITPDLRGFMLLLAVAFGAGLFTQIFLERVLRSFPSVVATVEPGFADPSQPLVLLSLLATALALIVRRHYVRRDWPVVVASTILVVAGVIVLAQLWHPDWSLFGARRPPDAAWTRPDATRLRRDGDALRVTVPGIEGSHEVAAPVVIDGLPADYTAAPFTLHSELTYADGTVVRTERAALTQMDAKGPFRPSLTVAYGPMQVVSSPSALEAWPTLLHIPAPVLARHQHQPGRYVGTFRYRLTRHEPLTTLPIEAGAVHVDGPRRLAIREVASLPSSCRVTLDMIAPRFLLNTPREAGLGFYFVDRPTGARLRTVFEWTPYPGHGGGILPSLGTIVSARKTDEVIAAAEDLATRANPRAPVPRRCEDTSLVVTRTTSDGTLTRTIEIPDLRIGSAEPVARLTPRRGHHP